MTWVRRVHKWIGLVLGLQLVLWMLSGLVMALLPHEKVAGEHNRREMKAPVPLAAYDALLEWPDIAARNPGIGPLLSIALTSFDGAPVYRVVTPAGPSLFNAATGAPLRIDAALAAKVAARDYNGPGALAGVRWLETPTLEVRAHQGPFWRVDFTDAEATSLYISPADGRILERRNSYWRAFDLFWMLHIMDYRDRADFNNPLVISAALILLWIGVTGIILWWDSFRREDFVRLAFWRLRQNKARLAIADSEGGAHRTLMVPRLKSLFEGLADEGVYLPSSCGGGGTCGLCRVRLAPTAPIHGADKRQIPAIELAAGYRLACQHRVIQDLAVTLPHGLLEARTYAATISASRFATPFIAEIRLRLPPGMAMDFRPGSYVQVTIPPFQATLDQLGVPEAVRQFWRESGTPSRFGTDTVLHRTYSLANAPGEMDGELVLNVRLALTTPDRMGVPVGIGSAYLASLKVGDGITLQGPFGDFHVRDEGREMVFIGGGAGMAPLRSMIRHQLKTRGAREKMTFWYGARAQDDIYYADEFGELEKEHANFTWHVALSGDGPHEGWRGARGLIHEVARERYLVHHPDVKSCAFYVCGPPAMLRAVLAMLEALGVPEQRIAFDDFGI
ncbi:MAG: NADH:ubiquinone reductase (Na(+)-transporting) subunit F [Pseudomonadota bacterium]